MKKPSLKKSISEKSKKVWEKATDAVSEVAKSVAEGSSTAWENTTNVASIVTDSAAEGRKKVGGKAVEFVKFLTKKGKVQFKDDVELLRSEYSILNEWTETKIPPTVMQSAVYAAAGKGALTNEVELARLSRAVMDSDSSAFQQILNYFFDAQEIKKISIWMDTVSGSGFAGEGV